MARKDHAVITPLGSRNDYSVAGDAAFAFNASDAVDKDQLQMRGGRGQELLLCRNTDSVAHVVTIEGVEDPFGRTITVSYTMPARSFAAFGPFEPVGWRQLDGSLYFNADDTSVQFAVLRVAATRT